MVQQLLFLCAPMLLGAQLILTLVLVKGDICPGQRGRIHKLMPTLAILWLAVASLKMQAIMVTFAIGYFYTQVQTKKTRNQGPLWALYLANGLALAFVGIQVFMQPDTSSSIHLLLQVVLLGAAFAHLLLVIARTRLQAFHRILPFCGVVAAMFTALSVLAKAYGLAPQVVDSATQSILFGLSLMISAIVVWCWHIFTEKAIGRVQLLISLAMLVASGLFHQGLFVL
ncbi:hypothetical protein M1D72_15975 [Vibrio sp. AK197]|uniref:Dimethyl sulfoxide reductase n=1 Tax=Vibrio olivae TaxID=1243002 RepID=A0ABV5HI43_9VIBR